MPLAASPATERRRLFSLPWRRSSDAAAAVGGSRRRLPAAYSPEAQPERQPGLATLVPTGLGGFSLVAASFVAAFCASAGVGVWEAVAGRPAFDEVTAGRFAATCAAVRQCLDIATLDSVGGWLAQICLVTAAAAARVVQSLRRHRRDGREGRHRAWGALAALFLVTACAGQAPIGGLFSALVSDACGIRLGPEGLGWWVAAAGLLYVGVGLWAVLPLHERAAAGTWLSLGLAAWAAAAACRWCAPAADRVLGPLGNACWMAGATLAAIGMLAAARSVIREVRGLGGRVRAGGAFRAAPTTTGPAANEAAASAAGTADERWASTPEHPAAFADRGRTEYIDGHEEDEDAPPAGRRLSKAERKRLRKLARTGQAA